MAEIKYDSIGYWSELKLDIIKEYATKYSLIMKNQKFRRYLYIDAFAGAGRHISRATGDFVPGSPLNALWVQPPFSEYHLIDINGKKARELRRIIGAREDVHIYEEDANAVLLQKVFPRCRWEDFSRALCLLDPYALTVNWEVIQAAGRMKTIEIFFNFMIMDANMNVLKRNPDLVSEGQAKRLDKAWGDRSWRQIAYEKQPGLFGDIESKVDNETVAEAFRFRLETVAGFAHVPSPLPMRNDQGAVVYYLYFASPNPTGNKIVNAIFKKYRNVGIK